MAMMISVAEVIDEVSAAKTRKERLAILAKNDCRALQACLKANFDNAIQFVDLGKKIEFVPDAAPFGHNPTTLHMEHKKFYIFMAGPSRLTTERRRQLVCQICEGLHPDEADIFYACIRKKLKRKGLTKALVKDAYPGLLPEPAPAKTPDEATE
ncbi:MAG: DUF6433 family protein [candidate division Zixibacteria bacterium]